MLLIVDSSHALTVSLLAVSVHGRITNNENSQRRYLRHLQDTRFWVDWNQGKCVQNCEGSPPCGPRLASAWEELFDDVQTCCKEKLSYLCPESGGDIPCEACTDADISPWATTSTTSTTLAPDTTLFYELDGKCVQNCEGDAPCGGINDESWVAKFDDVQECCKEKLAYLCPESGGDIPCEACTDADISAWTITTRTPITTTASSITQGLSSFEASEPIFEWYVDWDSGGVCVQNCNGSPPCGGMKNESWVEKFQDVKTCCTTRLYYKCPDPDVPCPACTIADISAWI